jgi:hypothetical protein
VLDGGEKREQGKNCWRRGLEGKKAGYHHHGVTRKESAAQAPGGANHSASGSRRTGLVCEDAHSAFGDCV